MQVPILAPRVRSGLRLAVNSEVTITVFEYVTTNIGNGIRNYNALKIARTVKCIVAYFGHAIGDNDGAVGFLRSVSDKSLAILGVKAAINRGVILIIIMDGYACEFVAIIWIGYVLTDIYYARGNCYTVKIPIPK